MRSQDEFWCVSDADGDAQLNMSGGTCGGAKNTRQLIERRNEQSGVLQDEFDQPVSSLRDDVDSLLPTCNAAARGCSESLFADQAMESTQPLFCTDKDILEGVAGSQVGHQAGGKDNERYQDEKGLCDGLTHRESDLATACKGIFVRDDEERSAEGVEREEDEVETDEELSEETRGKAQEEKGVAETGDGVETRKGNTKGEGAQTVREQGQERGEDTHEEGKDTNKLAGEVGDSFGRVMSSTPPVKKPLVPEKQTEMRNKQGHSKEQTEKLASAEYQQNDKDNGKEGTPPSVTEQEHIQIHSSVGGGQTEATTPTRVLPVLPPTIQVRRII